MILTYKFNDTEEQLCIIQDILCSAWKHSSGANISSVCECFDMNCVRLHMCEKNVYCHIESSDKKE